jgi:hypothetical protein
MVDLFNRSRSALSATEGVAMVTGARLAYRALQRPANDLGRPALRRAQRPLTPGEVNERLLGLLCVCLAAGISTIWIVSVLQN